MNDSVLNIEAQEFINKNLNSDISSLLFKGSPFPDIKTQVLIEQIEAKKRCKTKLSSWYNTTSIYYANKLNIEQTSSELTALYKSKLIHGDSIIDLTGGFGVDCYYFSKYFKKVTHCEINKELSAIVTHNYKQLQIAVKTIAADGLQYLRSTQGAFDWIYIDPSRRHDSKGKVFFLKDCLPNVPEALELLFDRSKNILIKTSPLLDLSIGIDELKHVKTIHIVAVNNEVKELLWVLEHGFKGMIDIKTVNITKQKQEHFDFKLEEESLAEANYSLPLDYLYEPNAAILKSGAFKSVAKKLDIYKLHRHSHIYSSAQCIDFPGRRFKIDKTLTYNKKLLKKEGIAKANITTRNFPETVQQIRKKLNIKEGGDSYLFFTTNSNNEKIVLICSKTE